MIAALKKVPISKLSSAYLALLRRLPLRPVGDDSEYERAADVLQELFGREDLDRDVRGYADTLALLIEAYDREHFVPAADRRSPLQRLKYLMDQSGLSISDLGQIVGSQPAASMVLNGKRQLSKEHIRRLADYFKVDPGYFF